MNIICSVETVSYFDRNLVELLFDFSV